MEIITLNKEAFQKKCNALFSKIDGNFDLVIGIRQGGVYVLEAYKQFNTNTNSSTVYKEVTLQRKTTRGLKSNAIVKWLLQHLPEMVLNWLRLREAKTQQRRVEVIDFQSVDFQIPDAQISKFKTVLVLDDAIDSGVTMKTVVNTVAQVLPNAKITTAVLSWTYDNAIIQPDVYLYIDTLLRFWWSLDYKSKTHG